MELNALQRRLARFLYGMDHAGQLCPLTRQVCRQHYCGRCETYQAKKVKIGA